jgi:hypothetical protein
MTPVDGWPHDPTADPASSATHNPDGTLKAIGEKLDESGTRVLDFARRLTHTFSTLHLGRDNDRIWQPIIVVNAQIENEAQGEPVNDEPGPGFDALRARRAERTTDVSDPAI